MSAAAQRILVVGPAWVGDMVMSQSLYIFLQNSRPGASIDVLAPPWSEPLIERMPEVAQAIIKPIGHGELGLGRRRSLGKLLRQANYQQVILLPNSFKSALAPFMAGIPIRTGWRGEMRYGLVNDMRILEPERLPLMVQRFVALGQDPDQALPEVLPTPHLVVDRQKAKRCGAKFLLDATRPILALCPGAEFGAAKRWPAEYYADIALRYLKRGWQVVLYGSDKDKAITAEILAGCGQHSKCVDLAGLTTLAEVVDLLSLSTAVISNDSGLMHIAAALYRPVLVVYGPTSPDFTPPLSDNAAMSVARIDCAPCYQRECPLGHHRCMRDTSSDQIAVRLEALLASSGAEE